MRPNPDAITAYLINNKEKIETGKIKKVEICIALGICERTVYRYLQLLGIKTIIGRPKNAKCQSKVMKKTNLKRIIRLEKLVRILARVLHEVQEDMGSIPHPSIIEILKDKGRGK